MGQVLRPETIIREIRDGEITINLNLTIKLDSDGLSIQTDSVPTPKKVIKTYDIEDSEELMIPDIDTGEMIDFGRKA